MKSPVAPPLSQTVRVSQTVRGSWTVPEPNASGIPSSRSPSDTAQPPASLQRRLKNQAKRGLRRLFEWGQRVGVDILPRHFYSEVPDIRTLRQDCAWRAPRSMVGVHGTAIDSQFEFVESCCFGPEGIQSQLASGAIYRDACNDNGEPGFSATDAEFLHAFIRSIRPRRVIQIGCGVSTAVMLRAAHASGYVLEIRCIEPYPTPFLIEAHRRGELELVAKPAQTVSLETLTDLGDYGLLFVDSTHTVKPGSEVNRLILEALPRLRPGTWVHFHDIYFPYDYQRGLLDDELFFCNETALLLAFLTGNDSYRIRASLSMLHHADATRLAQCLPRYTPAPCEQGLRTGPGDFPASIYLEVIERTEAGLNCDIP